MQSHLTSLSFLCYVALRLHSFDNIKGDRVMYFTSDENFGSLNKLDIIGE